WDWNEGQIIDVRVCSNAPKIELQLNGKTIGTHKIDHQKGFEITGWWKVPYEHGELKAIAYDENGVVIATDVRRSFGDAERIRLKADKEKLVANGTDLLFIEISMEDRKSTRLNSSHVKISYAVFCLKKKKA